MKKTCKYSGKSFPVKSNRQKYCKTQLCDVCEARGRKEVKFCLVCGKELTGKQRLYCSPKCKDWCNNEKKKHRTLNIWDNPAEDLKQQLRDVETFDPENGFYQDDRYWGLGESSLTEHMASDWEKEYRYIQYEKNRLGNRLYPNE